MGEGTDLSSNDIPVHRPETPAGFTHSSTRGLWPPEQLERQAHFLGFARKDKLLHVSVGSMEVVSVKGLTISFSFPVDYNSFHIEF